jgi:hypothetical protein
MKFLKIALVMVVLLINLTISQPTWADRPKVSKNADYLKVAQTINTLLKEQESSGSTPELKQRIDELNLRKATIESGITWGQCRNETGNTLAIYGAAPEKSKSAHGSLYFLADGETTPDGWDCNGVYLPTGIKVAGIDATEPLVFRIMDGTRLVAKLDPDTEEIAFNIPVEDAEPEREAASLPNISQAFISSRIPSPLAAEELDD